MFCASQVVRRASPAAARWKTTRTAFTTGVIERIPADHLAET